MMARTGDAETGSAAMLSPSSHYQLHSWIFPARVNLSGRWPRGSAHQRKGEPAFLRDDSRDLMRHPSGMAWVANPARLPITKRTHLLAYRH